MSHAISEIIYGIELNKVLQIENIDTITVPYYSSSTGKQSGTLDKKIVLYKFLPDGFEFNNSEFNSSLELKEHIKSIIGNNTGYKLHIPNKLPTTKDKYAWDDLIIGVVVDYIGCSDLYEVSLRFEEVSNELKSFVDSLLGEGCSAFIRLSVDVDY
jgi:hypothetical protein